MPLTDALIANALEITGGFEGADSPMAGVAGDFDGMGISLGVLQWNLGSGSLQPLVKAVGRAVVCRAMPTAGETLWQACAGDIGRALTLVRGWQASGRLRPAIAAELKRLAGSPEFAARQVGSARRIAERAWAEAVGWAKAWGRSDPSNAEFFWFFDLLVQNGGLKGVDAEAVRDFVRARGAERADDAVCAWLAGRPAGQAGQRDARRNASLWRDAVPSPRLPLFIASYLRAQRSKPEWRADVLNRKATVAVGRGWVHGRLLDVKPFLDGASPAPEASRARPENS